MAIVGCTNPQDAYTASKGGVLALTRSLAVQYGRQGVRANAICPGPILTPMTEQLFPNEEEKMKRLNRIPLGRFGRAEDIVNAGVFLASDESSWMTGSAVRGRWRHHGQLFLAAPGTRVSGSTHPSRLESDEIAYVARKVDPYGDLLGATIGSDRPAGMNLRLTLQGMT